ncbi:MAG TPA: hypothetical protein VH054_22245, partial [Polyangiaceae bacterium]|nr:hypothetical protein [Polyangiaceae bacterium]
KFPGEEEYLFRHEIVREAAYRMLTDDDRAIAHAQAGKWLETAGERDGVVLAEHFDKGGLTERAITQYLRATQQALDSSALDEAFAYAERGIALGASWESCGELRSRQAEIMLARGQNERACELGELALADLEPRSVAWCQAASCLVLASQRLADFERADALCRELLEGPKSPTGPYLRVAFTCLLYDQRDLANALAEKGAAVIKLPSERCRLHEYRQVRHKTLGDYAAAVAESERSVAAAKEANNLRLVAQAQTNLGDTLKELGAYAKSSAMSTEALLTAERIGYDQMAHVARLNLGITRAREGAAIEGLAIERAAMEAFQRQGDRRMSGMSNGYSAMILFEAGDLASAEHHARIGMDAVSALPPMRHVMAALLARILAASGRAREALPLARDAGAFLDGGGRVEEGESLVRLALAETLVALVDPSARAAIIEARRSLLERASRIGDLEYRRVFLECIPEHARTTELYVWQNTAADYAGT